MLESTLKKTNTHKKDKKEAIYHHHPHRCEHYNIEVLLILLDPGDHNFVGTVEDHGPEVLDVPLKYVYIY